ncbi:hypothetical protein WA538_002692 [Blastocystis sp. DL]
MLPNLTHTTSSSLFRACVLKRNNELIDMVYENTPVPIRQTYLFQAEYARALLSCGDYYTGIQIVRQFVNRGLRFSDCNNILLEGLSEGNYNEECLRLYTRIRQAMKEETEKPIRFYTHGYSAVIRSACRLKKLGLAASILREMDRLSITPLEFAYFELCEAYEHRTFWKQEMERVRTRLETKHVQLSEQACDCE